MRRCSAAGSSSKAMYYTYMLRCADGTVYTGITTDPQRRLREHLGAGKKAAGYTRSHRAVGFIALWQSDDRSSASRLETLIKTLPKEKKEQLAADGDLAVLKDRLDAGGYEYIKQSEV